MNIAKQTDRTEHFRERVVDLRQCVASVRANLVLLVSVAISVFAAGVLYALLAAPVYRADAVLQIDDETDTSLFRGLGEVSSMFLGKTSAGAEIELLRSRAVVGETVRRLHLDIDAKPRHFPVIGAALARLAEPGIVSAAPPGLGGFAWGGEKIVVSRFEVPAALVGESFTVVARDLQRFELHDLSGNVVLRAQVGETARGSTKDGAVAIIVEQLTARSGTTFAVTRQSTQLVVAELLRRLDIGERARQSGVIAVKLEGEEPARISEIVNTVANLYVQQSIERKSGQAQQMLSFLDSQLPQLRTDVGAAEESYNAFRARYGTVDLEEQGKLLLQKASDTRTRMLELQQQRSDLIQRFTPGHPSVVALDARVDVLRREQRELDALMAQLPELQQQALRLMRDVRVSTDMYMKLLDNAQHLRVLKAGQIGNVRMVDAALTPEKRVKPERALIVALAAGLGLVFGCAVVLARDLLRPGTESPGEIERITGIPVQAIIPHSARQRKLARDGSSNEPAVLAVRYPDEAAVEGLRSLRMAFRFGSLKHSDNVVMVTSPGPGDGKSFVAVNFAAVLAASGLRTLLIDADVWRGQIHTCFRVAQAPGLTDIARGVNVREAVRSALLPNLDVITHGSGARDRSFEMLIGDYVAALLREVGGDYDFVVIDAPPVLAVSDPTLIGQYAGTVLLAVRHGKYASAQLTETLRQMSGAGLNVNGLVLTDMPARTLSYGTFSDYRTAREA